MGAEFKSNPITVVTSVSEPAGSAVAVIPSDTGLLSDTTRGLYVGVTGDVQVDMAGIGSSIVFSSVPAGTILPIRVTRVWSTNTTAKNILALQSQNMQFNPLLLNPTVWTKADGILWQDSARTTPVTADGQSIGSADDAGGSSNNALQSGAAKPVYKVNIFGTLPAMLFTLASNQYLQTAAFTTALNQPYTILVSAKAASVAANQVVIDGGTLLQSALRIVGGNVFRMVGTSGISGPTADTNAHVFAMLFNTTSSSFYVDGGTATTGNVGANTMTKLTLGIGGDGLSTPFGGYILEVIVLDYLATLKQINAVGAYMAARIGTTWTTAV